MADPADQPRDQIAVPGADDLLALASRPPQVIAHPTWSRARETVLALVAAGPAPIVVLGPPGTGKTFLLRDLATTFGEQGWVVSRLDFGDGPLDADAAEIVLVDEADRMSAARLDDLFSHGDLAIVLAALPDSRERFENYPGVTIVNLTPLSAPEARAFLSERLAQLGLANFCLTEDAWARLIAHGRGVPRLLMALLCLALFIAHEEQAECVTAAHVEQAVERRGGSTGSGTDEPVSVQPDLAQSDVEPAPAELDLTQQGVLEIQAGAQGAPVVKSSDWVRSAPPRRRRSRVATMARVMASAAARRLRSICGGEMWRFLLTLVAILGPALVVLAGALSALSGKSWLELPSWLSSTITAETTPSAPRSQPTGGSPPLAVARQQAESDALQRRADTLQAQMSGLQQQADALQKDWQNEVAERQQQLRQMSGLQQQELQEMSGLQQVADVLQKEVAEGQQQMSDLGQQADALQKEVAERKQQLHQMSGLPQQELQQMVRRPHQPSIWRGAGDHQPNGVHRRRGQSTAKEEAAVRRLLLRDDLCARGFPAAAVDNACGESLAGLSARDQKEVGRWLLDVMMVPPDERAEIMRHVLTSAPVPGRPKRRRH
jgi:hypothetical protein